MLKRLLQKARRRSASSQNAQINIFSDEYLLNQCFFIKQNFKILKLIRKKVLLLAPENGITLS
jgi:hypothetical protein